MPFILCGPWAERLGPLAIQPPKYSQDGEEWIALALSKWCVADQTRQPWFVDVGCGDGRHLSNVLALYEAGWYGWLWDCDEKKIESARRIYQRSCYVQQQRVHPWSSLDTFMPSSRPEFLSLDIDGGEYELLTRMESRPTVMCVEHQARDGDDCLPGCGEFGQAGLSVMARMLATRDYELVAHNSCNGFYVHRPALKGF